MISARLRHYDAAPYLTMLLFCKRSAAGWSAEKREGSERTGRGKQRVSEMNLVENKDRVGVNESDVRAKDGEVAGLNIYHLEGSVQYQ